MTWVIVEILVQADVTPQYTVCSIRNDLLLGFDFIRFLRSVNVEQENPLI